MLCGIPPCVLEGSLPQVLEVDLCRHTVESTVLLPLERLDSLEAKTGKSHCWICYEMQASRLPPLPLRHLSTSLMATACINSLVLETVSLLSYSISRRTATIILRCNKTIRSLVRQAQG